MAPTRESDQMMQPDAMPIIDIEVEAGPAGEAPASSGQFAFEPEIVDSGVFDGPEPVVATPLEYPDPLADDDAPSPGPSQSGAMTEAARKLYATEALRSKDRRVAALFAIFLGLFGMHKFYLGYNRPGFVMLAVSTIGGVLTFGLAAIVIEMIAIVEGAIYLMRSEPEFNHVYVVNQRDWF